MEPTEKDRVTAFALYAPCIALADAVRELVDWECVQNIAEALVQAREEGRVEGRVEGQKMQKKRCVRWRSCEKRTIPHSANGNASSKNRRSRRLRCVKMCYNRIRC